MKYFKLFEQFIANGSKVNEAASKYYSLEDYMNDGNLDKTEKSAADQIAKMMSLDPKDIAIVTSEDDEIEDVEGEIGSASMVPFKTENKEGTYKYSKGLNVVSYRDSSLNGYFIPAKMFSSLFESKVNEASLKIEYSLEDFSKYAEESGIEDEVKLAADIARMLRGKADKIGVFTNEDDNEEGYDTLEAAFNAAGDGKAFNNTTGDYTTWYSKKANIVKSNDGSAIAYFANA